MRAMLALALRSAWSRCFVLSLLVATIALSTFVLLGLERPAAGATGEEPILGLVGLPTGFCPVASTTGDRGAGAATGGQW